MKMEKHFELTDEFIVNEFGVKLYRIKCTRAIYNVAVGAIGGFVEKEDNLSGNAWVHDDAQIYGNARVSGNAWIYGNACIYGDARVSSKDDYCCFQSFGSAGRTTTAFLEKDGRTGVISGCFSGSLEEFEKAVEATHGDGKYGLEYKAIINVIRIKFTQAVEL